MSYEKKLEDRSADRLDIGLLKFFWQINPLLRSSKNKIPKFLRNMEIFKNFSDLELWELSKAFHLRKFEKGDVVFNEGEQGVGFYLMLNGRIDIIIERDDQSNEGNVEPQSKVVISLEKKSYFGELALLQDDHIRNASAIAQEPSELIGIFKPDLDIIINEKPVVASKLLQSVSLIVANRLYSVTQDLRRLKERVKILEEEKNANKI